MKTRLLTATLIITTLLLHGCSKKEENRTSEATGGTVYVGEVTNVMKREGVVPNFKWKDSTGKTVDFDSFRGKVTLINFWATWCVPCKKELPDLIALSKDFADKNVKVLGISTDRGGNVREEVGTFVAERGIPYPILISNDELEAAFGNITGIPTTFVVDASGKIVQTFVGGRTKEMFAQAVTPLL